MGDIIVAVYRNGVLHPRQPLDLRESEEVRLQLLRENTEQADGEAAIRALAAAGLITPPAGRSTVKAISRRKRLQTARTLGRAPGKAVSQIIIEDRGEL